MKQLTFLILIAVFFSVKAQDTSAPLRFVQPVGAGTRAYGMANNHVALSSGIPDLYWNPAALSFSVTREFQGSLFGIKSDSRSLFFGTGTDANLPRFSLNNVGFSLAVPASRGGLSFGFSFSNPLLFDDISDYSGSYRLLATDEIVTVEQSTFRTQGGLNYWTGGFGMQIAPNFGIGLSTSLVTGREKSTDEYYETSSLNDTPVSSFDVIRGRYFGYDVRAGLSYKTKIVQAGMRVVAPQVLRLREEFNNDGYDDVYTMYSSWAGAVGLSATLPFLTISSELRGTLPFSFLFPEKNIPENSQASHTKIGGGIGVEIPMVFIPFIFRAGYSLDEMDLHPYMYLFEHDAEFDWSDGGVIVDRNRHLATVGFGYTSSSMSFDLSYGFSTWGMTGNTYLEQTYYVHRILASLAIRF